MKDVPQVDWRNDWLYTLILQEVERVWREWCGSRAQDPDAVPYVVAAEWSSGTAAFCSGEVTRAWIRNAVGLQEITLVDYGQHMQKLEKLDQPRPILVQFNIAPDRQLIAFGVTYGPLIGRGSCYRVHGEGAEASLVMDPSRGTWIS
jgi:hypothetical protein